MEKKFQKRKGFTLAEILIALIIIGVIVALAVPAAVENVNKRSLYSGLRSSYDLFNGATRMLLVQSKGNFTGYFKNSDDMANKYCSVMDCVDTCAANTRNGQCFVSTFKSLSQSSIWTSGGNTRIVLANGVTMYVELNNSNCSSAGVTYGGTSNNLCGKLHVDTNGFRGPNTTGRDVFEFWVFKYGIVPSGAMRTTFYDANWDSGADCSMNNSAGYGCAGRALMEGAMNY